jgi:hypothetical protein
MAGNAGRRSALKAGGYDVEMTSNSFCIKRTAVKAARQISANGGASA